MTKSYIKSRTINHIVIYSCTDISGWTENYFSNKLLYSLYMIKSYINSRTINHDMIYSCIKYLRDSIESLEIRLRLLQEKK